MALTPMMVQYLEIKKQNPDSILFFRLGDFYEMFLEDAKLASKELEITLTGRDAGESERIPMCGVPFHAADSYIARLIEKGYKVAICEQVEDAKASKGLVRREVTRVITPGALIDPSMLGDKENNYLLAICLGRNGYGLAIADLSTGLFKITSVEEPWSVESVIEEIERLTPREIIIPVSLLGNEKLKVSITSLKATITTLEDGKFLLTEAKKALCNHFGDSKVQASGCLKVDHLAGAAGALIQYLSDTQRRKLHHISDISSYTTGSFLVLDSIARRNLEITKCLRDGSKQGTLLWVLDATKTAMGGRMLRTWLEQPLVDIDEINRRLDAVEELNKSIMLRDELSNALKKIYDLERLAARAVYGSANGRDLYALLGSLEKLPKIRELLENCCSLLLKETYQRFDLLEDLQGLLKASLNENPPVSLRDGGLIKEGYATEVDKLRAASRDGKGWLAGLEAREKEQTGIKSLKVGFNKVFGYYLEVTRSNLASVPDYYQRRQTLANAERYITPELKEYESTILGAEDRLVELEYSLFVKIRNQVADQVVRIQNTANLVATIDVLMSLAQIAHRQGYNRPQITGSSEVKITDGRHPVVELTLGPGSFVPNDCHLDNSQNLFCLITGPNMGGKSTYQRQVALIVLMAQIGSFVPANTAEIGVVDRIFARVGASDDLSTGHSTFMVEMFETKQIIDKATSKSLVIIDELGRGTSNLEGMAIAQSVIEFLHNSVGCRTLFSTHYHELAELEGLLPGLKNYATAVKEQGDNVTFLRKVIRAQASKSYGIHCARLAGLPVEIILRANQLVEQLEFRQRAAKEVISGGTKQVTVTNQQLSLFSDNRWDSLRSEITTLDIGNMTPVDCLNYLHRLQGKLNKMK